MRREGRQHGMVRTHMILPSPYNPRPGSRTFTTIDSPPTAGFYTKVTSKPTNHSKFTAKCGKPRCLECHLHPVTKSKDKTKGSHKVKSNNLDLSHRLVSWRVVEGRPGLNFTGRSASEFLDHIEYGGEEDDEYYGWDSDGEEQLVEVTTYEHVVVFEDQGFNDVGLVLSQVEAEEEEEDEDWFLVGENVIV